MSMAEHAMQISVTVVHEDGSDWYPDVTTWETHEDGSLTIGGPKPGAYGPGSWKSVSALPVYARTTT